MIDQPSTDSKIRPIRRVSIVYPVLNEIDNVVRLAGRMRDLCEIYSAFTFEFLVVDDGSSDGTTQRLREVVDPGIDLKVVTLSRNFGAHAACTAGMHAASGACVVLMGADMQEPVSLLGDFLDQWDSGHDVVWGVRTKRASGGIGGKVASKGFSRLFSRYTDLSNYPAKGPSSVLCDRQVVDIFMQLSERHRNVYGLIAWIGFRQTTVDFDQIDRQEGSSKWTTRKLVKLAFDSLVEFSSAPIRATSYLGLLMGAAGFAYSLYLLIHSFLVKRGPEGFTTLVVLILVIGGVQLLMLGVLGEYLWRGLDETRQRPLFVIDSSRSTVVPAHSFAERRRQSGQYFVDASQQDQTGIQR